MKISDITETRLDELKVTRTSFSDVLRDSSIRMGFEAECVTSYEIPDVEQDDYNEYSWDQILHYVQRDRRYKAYMKAYEEWREGRGEDDDSEESDFIEDQFESDRIGAVRHFDLTTAFPCSQDPDEPDCGYILQDIAYELEGVLDGQVDAFEEYHAGEKNPNRWYVEPDSSVSSHTDRVPAEIVSPVFRGLEDGLAAMKTLFDHMEEEEWHTNKSTGLHVNLSIAGKGFDDFDYLKMMILYEEKFVAAFFDRLGNDYAKRLQTLLFDRMPDKTTVFPSRDEKGNQIEIEDRLVAKVLPILHGLSKSFEAAFVKKYSINNRGNGIFEFRSIGGADYHTKFDAIRKMTVNMANILRVGSDETANVKEYISKVYTLLDSRKFGDGGSTHARTYEVPMGMNSLTGYFNKQADLLDKAETRPLVFLNDIMGLISGKIVTDQQKRQIKGYALRNKVTQEQAKGIGKFLKKYERLCAIMGWKIEEDSD